MKILMLGNDSSVRGGITSVISQLLAHDWSTENVEMKFIPTYVETNNVKKILFFMKALGKIKKEFKANKPDVVHMHMSYKGSFTRKYILHNLCKNNRIPDVIHLHGSEFKKWFDESDNKKKEQIRTLLRESASFIVLGEKWNQIVKEIEPNTNTLVVSNTVHIPNYTVEWQQPFKVLFMGVLIERKGISDLIQAVKLLKAENKLTNVKFIIAGGGTQEGELKKQSCKFGLDDYIEFAGWVSGEKKERLLKTCQMFVLPSYNEGLPISILEAVSYGMPVVATDVGDISSAVIAGENGYLIEPGNVQQLADCILSVFENKQRYIKLRDGSKRIAEERFSDDKYFREITKCYKTVRGIDYN